MRPSASDAGANGGGPPVARGRAAGWIAYPAPNPDAATTLFCFPYAGGNASVFRDWPNALPAVNVGVVQLPGRANRFSEVPIGRLEPLRDAVAEAIGPHVDRPFALFGHSVGALLAFEVARRLRAEGLRQPSRLLVSAYPSPRVPVKEVTYDLPTEQFVAKVRELDGTPPEILESPELLEIVLPTLRADFAVADRYRYRSADPLSCPIDAFCGVDDDEISREDVLAWSRETTGEFRLHVIPGGHFFLHDRRRELLEAVSRLLDAVPGAGAVTAGVAR
jgi:medium-chain acyl-[acyl-carrier-protein] hydrolase